MSRRVRDPVYATFEFKMKEVTEIISSECRSIQKTRSLVTLNSVYVVQLDTQYSYVTEFIHKSVCSTMFRTSWVHLQERLSCVCGFGKWRFTYLLVISYNGIIFIFYLFLNLFLLVR
jgi:hypothetical protein